jgi:hypothetical protein
MRVAGFSAHLGTSVEVVVADVDFVNGHTYIMVKGANEASSATAPYTLQVETSVPNDTPESINAGASPEPVVDQPSTDQVVEVSQPPEAEPLTLFVTQSERIDALYADASDPEYRPFEDAILHNLVAGQDAGLAAVCEDPRVNGEVISVPAAIYEAWMLHFDRALFADDLRGGLYDEMTARSNPIFLLNVLSDPVHRTVWCDDVLSIEAESCDATATTALDQALDDLEGRLGKDMTQWQWRKLHIARFPHNPFSQVSYLAWLFDRSIPNGGDRYTVNAAPVKMSSPYNQLNGPGYRHIVNLADLSGSQYVITTGQSGNVLSADYANLLPLWRDVEYVPMTFGRENMQGGQVLKLEGR